MRWKRSASCANSSGATCACWGRARNSTSRSRRPAAWPISSNLAELMCLDALERNESCGGHFREEYQTPEGEALRDDEDYSYVAAWEFREASAPAVVHQEPLGVRIRAPQPTELQIDEPHAARLAAESQRNGPDGPIRGPGHQSAHVLPGDARCGQRRPDREGRGADRVRSRLPRGHLRHVRIHDQRRGPRAGARHHRVPASHAPFQRRRRALSGAVARRARFLSSAIWR